MMPIDRRADPRRRAGWQLAIATLAAAWLACGAARAEEQDATRVFKAMTDYVGAQGSISFTFDSDIEIVTPRLMKLQFNNSGQVALTRPDKLRMTRTGGYADIEFVFDGKTATLFGKNLNTFAQFDIPGTTAELIEGLRSRTPLELPGADLFSANVFEELMADAYDRVNVGRGVIDGVECEHLAFRTPDVDWQIWIQVGPQPIPRKYVITSKTITGGPQYTLRIKDWRTDPVTADTFVFKPASGARMVDLSALAGLDELPEGMAFEAGQGMAFGGGR